MAISNELHPCEVVKPLFLQSVLQWPSDFQQCSLAITRRILDDFVNQETGEVAQRFLALRLTVRKAFKRGSLRFRLSRNWLETALHGSKAQATLVFDDDCCCQSLCT